MEGTGRTNEMESMAIGTDKDSRQGTIHYA